MTMDWNATDTLSQHQQGYSTPNHSLDDHDNHHETTFYVVQKCWYSGPRVEPAVDYLRLLTSACGAEHVAYQSAHCYAAAHNAAVRTLLLTKEKQSASQYGFYAAGSLFWVRQMRAPAADPSTPPPYGKAAAAATGAHVMLTAGVIGGTGNPNIRRTLVSTEQSIFVGAGSAAPALQAAKARPVQTVVTYVPVSSYCPGDWWKDWPDRHLWGQQVSQQTMQEQPEKRPLDHPDPLLTTVPARTWAWNASPTHSAKRQCRAEPPMPKMEATPTTNLF